MRVDELMSKPVIAVHPQTSLAEAAKVMLARQVTGLPVVGPNGKLLGMVTEADLLCRAELHTEVKKAGWLTCFLDPGREAKDYVRAHGRKVDEVMTRDLIVVYPDSDLGDAARLMHDRHLKRLPVVQNENLVGIISRLDILRALVPKLDETAPLPEGEGVKEHIERALRSEKSTARASVRVAVNDHCVVLDGIVFSDAERQAVKVVAENTPGVEEVQDHLTYVDPTAGMAYPLY